MKKLIIISLLTMFAFSFENPNGKPFLLTINVKQQNNKPNFKITLPISKYITISAEQGQGYLLTNFNDSPFYGGNYGWATIECGAPNGENCNGGGGDYVRIEEEDVIDLSSPSFSIDVHIPLFKLLEPFKI